MYQGKSFQIGEGQATGTDEGYTGKSFQVTKEKPTEIGGFPITYLRAAPPDTPDLKWTPEEIKDNYDVQTEFLQYKYPEKIDPIEYMRKGVSFGWGPNVPKPSATTLKQKAMETAGWLISAVTLQSITSPIIGGILGKIPGVAKPLAKITQEVLKHPWKVGYPLAIGRAGAWGGLFGAIEKAENRNEWAKNTLIRAGTFAAFQTLAYPIIQFFRPVVYEMASNKKYWADPNVKRMLSTEGMREIYSPPKTLYFRHPTDKSIILKVTNERIDVLPFGNAPSPGKAYPIFGKSEIQVFKSQPSLYNKLKDFLKGKITSVEIPKVKIDALAQNAKYTEVFKKLEKTGSGGLTNEELNTLAKGLQSKVTAEGIKPITPANKASDDLLQLYSGVPIDKIKNIPVTLHGTKMKLIDALGATFVRYYGLTPELRRELVKMMATNDLRKADLTKFFKERFPISSEQAKLLTYHQENPAQNPIPAELNEYAKQVTELVELSQKLQAERNLQGKFFPESFIKKAEAEILQHQEIIPKLVSEQAITRHKVMIDELNDYIEFLKGLKYVPHLYLQSEEIERNLLRLMPEGRITSRFRSSLSKLKGRKIATLEDAKAMGLIPEEDIRVLLGTHFEYLFRKIGIYDTIERLKGVKQMILPETEAPKDWHRVAISQLDGYRVHPLLVKAIEDFAVTYDTSLIGRGYDSVNQLGKAIVFFNPIILNFWDIFQGYAAGGWTPWRPTYTANLARKSFWDTINESELYKEAIKGGLFSTPTKNFYSPTFEQSMRVVVNQMEEDYPGWKKAIEKITGRPVDWKTFTVIPDLYKANWRLTWAGDRIQRMMTLRSALDRGMSLPDAIDWATTFHANYNIFTRGSKKWLNRLFLVPTYKANMIVALPSYIAKQNFTLAKNIATGQKATPEQLASLSAFWRLLLFIGASLSFAAWRGYYLREGYRLVKQLEKPEITKEGKILTERVITLPGPFFEIPKFIERIKKGPEGLYMYMAKIPQIAWGLERNARWMGDPYWTEGASTEYKTREIMTNLIKDYIAPVDRLSIMTNEETDTFDNILSTFGLATYKRGSTESRIFYEIQQLKYRYQGFLRKPSVSVEDKRDAAEEYQDKVQKLLNELEDFRETYK